MQATTYINILEDYIPNPFFENLFSNLDSGANNISVSLRNLYTTFTGYGHWNITVELTIEGEKLIISRTTTNSEAVSLINNSHDDLEKAEGYQALITECINFNEANIMQFIEQILESNND